MSYRVGLTGGIGSGKSTVAQLFSEYSVPVIDTDALSHQLTQPGGLAMEAIRSEFGNSFIDATGALDRDKMRQLVFSDPQAKQRLESILHPLILAQTRLLADSSSAPYVLLVIPLLFESRAYQTVLQRTLVVDCSQDLQLKRAVKRSGLGEAMVRAIMEQQLPRSQRLLLADDVIHNDDDCSALGPQIDKLHRFYLSLAERSN